MSQESCRRLRLISQGSPDDEGVVAEVPADVHPKDDGKQVLNVLSVLLL